MSDNPASISLILSRRRPKCSFTWLKGSVTVKLLLYRSTVDTVDCDPKFHLINESRMDRVPALKENACSDIFIHTKGKNQQISIYYQKWPQYHRKRCERAELVDLPVWLSQWIGPRPNSHRAAVTAATILTHSVRMCKMRRLWRLGLRWRRKARARRVIAVYQRTKRNMYLRGLNFYLSIFASN